ncbi:hypothetical protein MTR_8g028025 [Medicago truncatula]|uniref:Protein FAR1-RELATED SEQUENCE n=1 Tax=Medicago truncatula TaxID=3880 RepID=A0A072TPD0_MEDTR|nr:hypothetical protein MTR_8g028025 [Medicago truncatula]
MDYRVNPKPKDVKVYGKEVKETKEVKAIDVVGNIMRAWEDVVESLTKDSYTSAAWTDGVLHLGCRTSNIVELVHGKLKNYLRSNKMLAIQLSEIGASFGRRLIVLEHRYKDNFLHSELEGCVFVAALCLIFEEAKPSKTLSFSKKDCGCVIKTSYGLPCACILAIKIQQKLLTRLDDIYPHWQRLRWNDIYGTPHQRGDASASISRRHNVVSTSKKGGNQGSKEKGDGYTKRVIYGKSARIGNSLRSSVSSPNIYSDLNLLYITQMPKIMRPYIKNIVNVKRDGIDNCGFRVITRHMGIDEGNHTLVHSALIHEFKTKKHDYLPIFDLEERFEYIMNGLLPPTNSGGIGFR